MFAQCELLKVEFSRTCCWLGKRVSYFVGTKWLEAEGWFDVRLMLEEAICLTSSFYGRLEAVCGRVVGK
ncbi:MAG: hypothetical protein ACTS5F_00975 [Candidatus Hodgkinia cicadicola]